MPFGGGTDDASISELSRHGGDYILEYPMIQSALWAIEEQIELFLSGIVAEQAGQKVLFGGARVLRIAVQERQK